MWSVGALRTADLTITAFVTDDKRLAEAATQLGCTVAATQPTG